MDFEWDPGKAEANHRKHGVDFADVVAVFEDPSALSRPDPFPLRSVSRRSGGTYLTG